MISFISVLMDGIKICCLLKSLYVKEQLNKKAAENCSSCKLLTTHILYMHKTLCSSRSKNAFDLIFSPSQHFNFSTLRCVFVAGQHNLPFLSGDGDFCHPPAVGVITNPVNVLIKPKAPDIIVTVVGTALCSLIMQ